MSNFRTIDRETGFLLPPSVDEWLPEKHLARFVVEVVDGLDLRAMSGSYRGSGSASYHPRMLLGLLVYGYATGVFSSRKLERATYNSVAFRFIAANDHPDHDTIATFRRRFLEEIEALFVQVLLLAREMGVLKMGTVALDGTKMHANASRHSALSHEHACKIEAQLKADRRSDRRPRRPTRREPPTACRYRTNWRGARSVCASWPRRGRRSRRGPRNAMRASRRSTKPSSRRGEGRGERERAGGKPPEPPVEGPRPTGQYQPDRRGVAHHAGGRRRLDQCYNARPRWRREVCWWWRAP